MRGLHSPVDIDVVLIALVWFSMGVITGLWVGAP